MTEQDIDLPEDTSKSRLRPRGPVTGYTPDPDDIATVDARVAVFREQYPEGRIKTKVRTSYYPGEGDPRIVHTVTASVTRIAGGYIASTATASRTEGQGEEPYASRALETAESTAINRALRFLAIQPMEQS